MQLDPLFLWIESSDLSRAIVTIPWIYPTISALHIIGIAVLFGSIVSVDLRLLRITGPQFDAVLQALVRAALIGFAIAATSGLLLASVRIGNYLENPAFLAKMAIICVAGANALLLRILSRSGDVAAMAGGQRGRIAATLSICLWISAVFAGRWIAFT